VIYWVKISDLRLNLALNEGGGSLDYAMIPLTEEYFEFVRMLRNDNVVKVGFINQQDINREDHLEYMKMHATHYFVCLGDSEPIGYIGVIDNDIRIAVLPEINGQGAGEFMLRFIMEIYPLASAKVKVENIASMRLFEKCGFTPKFLVYSSPADPSVST